MTSRPPPPPPPPLPDDVPFKMGGSGLVAIAAGVAAFALIAFVIAAWKGWG